MCERYEIHHSTPLNNAPHVRYKEERMGDTWMKRGGGLLGKCALLEECTT
jgi:hypothetical protein